MPSEPLFVVVRTLVVGSDRLLGTGILVTSLLVISSRRPEPGWQPPPEPAPPVSERGWVSVEEEVMPSHQLTCLAALALSSHAWCCPDDPGISSLRRRPPAEPVPSDVSRSCSLPPPSPRSAADG